MSLINQMITRLEERGAEGMEDMALVRPVSKPKASPLRSPLLLGGAALLLVMVASAWYWQGRKDQTVEVMKPLPILQPAVVVSEPAVEPVTPPAAPVTPTVAVPVAPVAVAEVTAAPKPAAKATVKAAKPATVFQLSFELGSVGLTPVVPKTGKAVTSKAAVATSPKASSSAPVASVEPGEVAAAVSPAAPAPATSVVSLGNNPGALKQVSPKQQAEAEFRKAVAQMQQGRIGDALAGYETTLKLDAGHDQARQALVLLLLENKRTTDAEQTLLEAIKSHPEKIPFVMMTARLQVERGALNDGVQTLERSLPFAGQNADLQAFLAALLQRQERHKEAVEHYQVALQHAPNNGLWLMGSGISLQALQRYGDAKDAYSRALATQTLRPELQNFVQQKLKDLGA